MHPANDTLLGWAPDGKQLLFGSDRTGTIGVWTLAVLDGKIQGSPELIKPAIGQVVSLGLAQSGALYFGLMSGVRDVYVASIDFTSGELVSPPTRPVQSFIGNNNFPDWSPDGKYLSYTSQRGSVQLLALRSVETGKTRELRPNLLDIYGRRYWSPDGRSIAATARDPKGRHGVYRIDVETGEAALIALSDPGAYSAPVGWSPDAQKLYYRRWDPTAKASHVTERELASGKERDVLTQAHGLSALSPDGRQLAFVKSDRSTRSSMLRVIPVEGGQPEELVRVQSPESIDSSLNSNYSNLEWTPDGRSVIFRKDNGQQHELWLVSLADGKSRKLPIDLPVRQVRLHPDGRQITFLSSDRTREVWVMENFLPTIRAKK